MKNNKEIDDLDRYIEAKKRAEAASAAYAKAESDLIAANRALRDAQRACWGRMFENP